MENPILEFNMKKHVFKIEPVAAPRINRGDTWLMKKASRLKELTAAEEQRYRMLVRYYNFKTNIAILAKEQSFELPDANWHVMFYKPMPTSWSKTKRKKMRFTPCKVMPDTDNFLKSFKDALRIQDKEIYDERASKFWAEEGFIEVVINIPRISKILRYVKDNYGESAFNEILELR